MHATIHILKPTDCTEPRLNSNVNHGFWVLTMGQRWFISFNKYTALVQDADSGGSCGMKDRCHWRLYAILCTLHSIFLWTWKCSKNIKSIIKEKKTQNTCIEQKHQTMRQWWEHFIYFRKVNLCNSQNNLVREILILLSPLDDDETTAERLSHLTPNSTSEKWQTRCLAIQPAHQSLLCWITTQSAKSSLPSHIPPLHPKHSSLNY